MPAYFFFFGVFCPRDEVHAVAVGWMYLIGVMGVLGGTVDTGLLSKRLTILKIYSVTDSVKKVLNVLRLPGSWPQ